MPSDSVDIMLRLRGHRQVAGGLKKTSGAVDKFGRSQDRAARSSDRMDRSARRGQRGLAFLTNSAKLGGLALGAGLVVGAKKSITAFEEARKVSAQTGAVIKSTGGVANVTGKDVDSLTGALMRKTAIDDETIRKGANMLLTFTNVRNEAGKTNKVFDQSVVAATDMATALGSDPKSAALMLGKALNDPAKGLGRLSRSGVVFTDSQKKQIESMQKSGDLLGAQKIILAEVNKEFGGSAAAAKTPMMALQTTMGELSETVGGFLAPAVDAGAKALNTFFTQMQTGKGLGGAVVAWIRGAVVSVRAFFAQLGTGSQRAAQFRSVIANLRTIFNATFPVMLAVARRVLPAIVSVVRGSLNVVAGIVKVVASILKGDWRGAWQGIKQIVRGAIQVIIGSVSSITAPFRAAFGGIVRAVAGLPGRIASASKGMFNGWKEAYRSAINWIIDRWNGLEFKIPGFDPPGPGPKFGGFTLGMPDIPHLAAGGTFRQGGVALVGDRGPEILSAPAGARVDPLPSSGLGGITTVAAELRAAVQALTERPLRAEVVRSSARRAIERDQRHQDARA